jgi:hypothetical protein
MNDLPPPDRAPSREPLGALRIVLAIIGIAAVLFSGGCSLLVLSDGWDVWPFTLAFGGVPFALGVLVTWMALRLGRGAAP